MMNILFPILVKCMSGIQSNKPYCDITVVATRVTKEKKIRSPDPMMCTINHAVQDSFGAMLSIYFHSICLFIINLVSS